MSEAQMSTSFISLQTQTQLNIRVEECPQHSKRTYGTPIAKILPLHKIKITV